MPTLTAQPAVIRGASTEIVVEAPVVRCEAAVGYEAGVVITLVAGPATVEVPTRSDGTYFIVRRKIPDEVAA